MPQLTLAATLATGVMLAIFAAALWLFDGKPFEPPVAANRTRAVIAQDAIEQLLDADPAAASVVSAAYPAADTPARRRDGLPRN